MQSDTTDTESVNWPSVLLRTNPSDRKPYPHGYRVSRYQAFNNIVDELERMDVDASTITVETAAPHQSRKPHQPYKDADPDDPSVVVRFHHEGANRVVGCDRWDCLRDNAQSIAKYLEAKRGMERWGVQTPQSEFEALALPAADGDVGAVVAEEPPHQVLGVDPDASERLVTVAYQERMKEAHPDQGGSRAEMDRVQRAKEAMLDG